MLAVFSVTALVSAFLVFWIEPLFTKMALPLLGGSPAVWNTCLMYFQTLLLLGYLYAHLSTRYLALRRQVWMHAALLAVAFLALPIAIPRGWTPPPEGSPIAWLVILLTAALGGPFFVLCATAPLLQRWLASADHPAAANPYKLYAASNAGSFLGLLAFPVLMEPHLRLGEQSRLWSAGYALAFALTLTCGALAWMRGRATAHGPLADSKIEKPDGPPPTGRDRVKWIALAFVPSSLLLGVTTYLSTDVASAPFLWVIPLALYLLTFVIVFSRTSREPNLAVATIHAFLVTVFVIVMFWSTSLGLRWAYPLNLGLFAATALVLHGELAASRPSPVHLTEYYLWMALGGALGGAFNAIIAPLLFHTIAEYQVVMVMACFLRPGFRLRTKMPVLDFAVTLIPAALLLAFVKLGLGGNLLLGIKSQWIASAVAAGIVFVLRKNALRFGLSVATIALVGMLFLHRSDNTIYAARSFFGAYQVLRSPGPANFLFHGTTIHGAEFLDSARRDKPITYYHQNGPVGQLFGALDGQLRDRSIGVVGLGAGSILCYSKAGEDWTFFEIDPLVETIARNPRYFTFLNDCAVRPRVLIGDARLTLARLTDRRFALLVVDAFSSDAIPVHLLTREALAVYMRVLDDHGVLFVHISNQNLDLHPIVAAMAADRRLVALIAEHVTHGREQDFDLDYSCDWVAMARRKEDLGPLARNPRWRRLASAGKRDPWTDDYSNVFSVIKW